MSQVSQISEHSLEANVEERRQSTSNGSHQNEDPEDPAVCDNAATPPDNLGDAPSNRSQSDLSMQFSWKALICLMRNYNRGQLLETEKLQVDLQIPYHKALIDQHKDPRDTYLTELLDFSLDLFKRGRYQQTKERVAPSDLMPSYTDTVFLAKADDIGEGHTVQEYRLVDSQDMKRFQYALDECNILSSTEVIVVPELSPVSIEIIGAAFQVDYRVFSRFIMSDAKLRFPYNHLIQEQARQRSEEADLSLLLSSTADHVLNMNDLSSNNGASGVKKDEPYSSTRCNLEMCWRCFLGEPALPQSAFSQLRSTFNITTLFHVMTKPYGSTVLVLLSPLPYRYYREPRNQARASIAQQSMSGSFHPFLTSHSNTLAGDSLSTTQFDHRKVPPILYSLLNYPSTKPEELFQNILSITTERFKAVERTRLYIDKNDLEHIIAHMKPYLNHEWTEAHFEYSKQYNRALEELKERAKQQLDRLDYMEDKLTLITPAQLNSFAMFTGVQRRRVHEHIRRMDQETNSLASDRQTYLTDLQIQDSRSSVKQNEQIRRITILAFVWIPISGVCSIFGMNAKELILNPPPIWIAILVAGLVTFLAVTISCYSYVTNIVYAFASNSSTRHVFQLRSSKLWHFGPGISERMMRFLYRLMSSLLAPIRAVSDAIKYLHNLGKLQRRELQTDIEKSHEYNLDRFNIKGLRGLAREERGRRSESRFVFDNR